MFYSLGYISEQRYIDIKKFKPEQWSIDFSKDVYKELDNNMVYITNLAKCTQLDARPLPNTVFKEYLELMYREIEVVNPKYIVSFGNQVSSILLKKNISVSEYIDSHEELVINDKVYKVYPTYYPV